MSGREGKEVRPRDEEEGRAWERGERIVKEGREMEKREEIWRE